MLALQISEVVAIADFLTNDQDKTEDDNDKHSRRQPDKVHKQVTLQSTHVKDMSAPDKIDEVMFHFPTDTIVGEEALEGEHAIVVRVIKAISKFNLIVLYFIRWVLSLQKARVRELILAECENYNKFDNEPRHLKAQSQYSLLHASFCSKQKRLGRETKRKRERLRREKKRGEEQVTGPVRSRIPHKLVPKPVPI
ncbi:hypothetical protein J6590_028686 [Homalodisca vitripennis]|nr:hypothetical protein J6590_028686 [Homalodisca vitripennis]